ncbi:MAG: hypothetical protein AB7G48_17265 [Nitrospiraceae bacterium]
MKRILVVALAGMWFGIIGVAGSVLASGEMLGGEPREFHVAILSSGKVSFILPSTIVVDEKVKLKPLELVVTNDTKEKHGFAIDKLKVKEVLNPGETKSIKLTVTDLDSLGGTEQAAYRMYDPVHAQTVGGQMFVKR